MSPALETVLPWLAYLMAVILGIVSIYGGVIFLKSKQHQRQIRLVQNAILDYFQRNGVAVAVGCVSLNNDKRFTAFIESEPMKRFRLSHIIEMTVREHVAKTCKLELAKIYWRFPINKDSAQSAEAGNTQASPKVDDDYINEGLVHYRDLPKIDVSEMPWESFEEVVTKDPNATHHTHS